MASMTFEKNKFRQGYTKLIDVLDSCNTWAQFEAFEHMAKSFFDMVGFYMDKYEHYSHLHPWRMWEFKRWTRDIQYLYNDVVKKRDEFADYNKKREEEAKKDPKAKKAIVVTGFHDPSAQYITLKKRKKNGQKKLDDRNS